jgi:hypothetical protein
MFPDYKDKNRTVMQTFIKSRPDQVFDSFTWNHSLAEGTAVYRGKRLWNLWKAPDWFGEQGDVTPWLLTMDKVFDRYMDIVMKRMACDIQYPEARPQWHVLVTGGHGIGKSSYVLPLAEWAGRFNLYGSVSSQMITETYNAWISHKKIITINEVFGVTSAQFDKLMKDVLAGIDATVSVHDKYIKRFDAAVVASLYMSSNHPNPLSISTTERRLFVYHSREVSPQDPTVADRYKQEFYDQFRWVKANWPKVIWYLKHQVKVDPDFVQTHPGVTAGQLEMASLTAPAHERMASYIKEAMHNVPVFRLKNVQDALANNEESEVDRSRYYEEHTIRKALSYLGAVKAGKKLWLKNGADKPEKYQLWSLDRELEKAPNWRLRFLWEALSKEED